MLFLIGILLLPVCAAVTLTLAGLFGDLDPSAFGGGLAGWALIGGFLFWVFVYLVMTRPVRTYVLAHELTHALWGYLMGAGVSKLKVSAKGGSVQVSKNNVFITLAPYFFPFYTVCVLLLYGLLTLFWDLSCYEPFWLALVGLTWGFHVTFTVSMLMQHQSDIARYGRIFSYTLIYLLNVQGVCLWVVAAGAPTLGDFWRHFSGALARVGGWLWSLWQSFPNIGNF